VPAGRGPMKQVLRLCYFFEAQLEYSRWQGVSG
jgi:hypothetical protein